MSRQQLVTGRDVAAQAAAVLESNWRGTHTVPASGLYPHQWSWDSGFIAMGLRWISPERAGREMDSLLSGQWADGRIPQIIFDPNKDRSYSPGASFWRSGQITGSPKGIETTGLIQPPNHAWATWKIHEADRAGSNRRSFLKNAYPSLVAWHRYLETRRNRGGRGLASIVHPWESGTDNSPLWDDALAAIPSDSRTAINRPDLLHADAAERPSRREYGKYFWLAERYRDHDCDDADQEYPFLFEDPLFNTLWAVSELALANIASELGLDAAPHLHRADAITSALERLFDEKLGCYVAWDVHHGTAVRKATVNGLAALLLPDMKRSERLLETLKGARFLGVSRSFDDGRFLDGSRSLGGQALLVPSYDGTAPDLNAALYWRGPAWFNMNWLIIQALDARGERTTSDRLSANLLRLAQENDFPEYVNPWTGTPHGTRRFSWTAALALDIAYSRNEKAQENLAV